MDIVGPDGEPFARGFVGYGSQELGGMLGHHGDEGESLRPVVHRDQFIDL